VNTGKYRKELQKLLFKRGYQARKTEEILQKAYRVIKSKL
jgi:hypothetical protein